MMRGRTPVGNDIEHKDFSITCKSFTLQGFTCAFEVAPQFARRALVHGRISARFARALTNLYINGPPPLPRALFLFLQLSFNFVNGFDPGSYTSILNFLHTLRTSLVLMDLSLRGLCLISLALDTSVLIDLTFQACSL